MRKRKKYSKEFKLNAVSLVIEQGFSKADAARSLDISSTMLGRWIKELEQEEDLAFRGNGKMTPEQERIRSLEAKVKQLEMEKQILKEATVFFAKETKKNIRS